MTCDLSFISIGTVWGAVRPCLAPGWRAMVMVKPQFEVGRERVGSGGVVRDPEAREDAVRGVVEVIEAGAGASLGTADSGLPGPKGNREVFVHAVDAGAAAMSARAPLGSGGADPIERASPVKRVLLLTHREPAVTESNAARDPVDPRRDAGVKVLVPAGEVVKHRTLTAYSSSDGMDLRPGGEDLILVLGGDGSILRALAREAGSGAPVIGVNYGRVGFLASIERETLERDLRRALAGEFVVLGLPSLKAEWSDGEVQAVNDLALFRGGESRIADLTYAVDGEVVATVRCDGVVLSTPVGSTAYNLAAGGPTVSWRVRCFVLSFIALHHLDSRPLVIGAEELLTVTNSALVGDVDVQADGQRIGELRPGRSITVGLSGDGGAPGHLPGGIVLPPLPGEVRPAVIRSLEVRDLVVIERAELAPPAGLTAITGETGAGKTVLAQALGLLAGAPADAGAVRPGARHALVQATLALPGGFWDAARRGRPRRGPARARRGRVRGRHRPPGAGRGARAGADRRPGRPAGGGRGPRAGADPLLRPARAPAAGEPREPARGARRLRGRGRRRERGPARRPPAAAPRHRPRPRGGAARAARRPSASAPSSRSWSPPSTPPAWIPPRRSALRAERERLRHAEGLAAAAAAAAEALSPADDAAGAGAVSAVGGAARALEPLVPVDAALAAPHADLAAAEAALQEAALALRGYLQDLDAEPGRLAVVEDRLDVYARLARRHGPGTAEVIARAEAAREALRGLDEGAGEVLALAEERAAVLDEAVGIAAARARGPGRGRPAARRGRPRRARRPGHGADRSPDRAGRGRRRGAATTRA